MIPVSRQIENIAWSFRSALSAQERKECVRAAFTLAGEKGIEVLAKLTGCNIKKLKKIGEINSFRKEYNRWRRGRGPNPLKAMREREYAAITARAASWKEDKKTETDFFGEDRRGRRNTFSNTTNRPAARS